MAASAPVSLPFRAYDLRHPPPWEPTGARPDLRFLDPGESVNQGFVMIEHQPLPPNWPAPERGLTGYLATLVDTTQDDRCFLGFLAPPGLVPDGPWTPAQVQRACAWVASAALDEKEAGFDPVGWLKEKTRPPCGLKIRPAGKMGATNTHTWPADTSLEVLDQMARADRTQHLLEQSLADSSAPDPALPAPRL